MIYLNPTLKVTQSIMQDDGSKLMDKDAKVSTTQKMHDLHSSN
jgi:hypothetical protein